MKLQELLDYRSTCLIHNLPMKMWSEPDKKANRKSPLECIRTSEGLVMHHPNDPGEVFGFDGTHISRSNIFDKLKISWIVGVMCEQCHKVPTHKFMGRTVPSLDNIKLQVHFYTFNLLPQEGGDEYKCLPGMEIIKHFDGDKFYHMTGHVGGGTAAFNMGNLVMEDTLDQLIGSTSIIKVPKFNPAVITSIAQMMEKMKIYNLFS